jgi:Transposase DDE domain
LSATRNSSKRTHKTKGRPTNGAHIRRVVSWVVNEDIFTKLKLHGNVKWSAASLVCLAIFWVWSDESSLVQAALDAVDLVRSLFGTAAVQSYQALTGALRSYTDQLLPVMWARLHSLMEEHGRNAFRIGRWLPLAADGSRLLVPRTAKNESRFCKPPKKRNKKRKKRGRHAKNKPVRRGPKKSHYAPQAVGPQIWLTLVWHIGMRLPWCWRIGPSYSSERGHLLELIREQTYPKYTLFCCDAGFVGYDFWQEIATNGHHFLVRVGGNVRLLKKLGYVREGKDIVYCWPDEAMKKKQPPLVLRLLQFSDRRGIVYLVTNVLNDKDLTHAQANKIYRGRWGIEIQFRSFKQTFGRCKLRSRTPDNAAVELHWSLLGLWMLQLLAFKEQTIVEEPAPKTSIASVLRIMRSIMNKKDEVPQNGKALHQQLEAARIDDYERQSTKRSRNYPRKKEEPNTGEPIISMASKQQKQRLREVTPYELAA